MTKFYCKDRKCLRKVCTKHSTNVPKDQDAFYAEFEFCTDRIHMKGDEYEEYKEDMDSSEVDTSSSLGSVIADWPDTSRIDIIGSNGNDGDHYEDSV